MQNIHVANLVYDVDYSCLNCPICGCCVCGDETYGHDVCALCVLNLPRYYEGKRLLFAHTAAVFLRTDETIGLARAWEDFYKEKFVFDWDAHFAAIDRLGLE